MNIYDHVFSSAQVAEAAGMSHANFRAYLTRPNRWRVIGTKGTVGKSHLFTIFDCLTYALAYRLVQLGVDPAEALNRAALDFAHTGDEDRDPGGLFRYPEHGATLYVYCPGAPVGKCVGSSDINSPLELFFAPMSLAADSAVVIDLSKLRDRVFASLGLDARDYE